MPSLRPLEIPLAMVAVCAIAVISVHGAPEKSPEPKTFVYNSAGGVDIKADVYPAGGDESRPVVLWIHGGALMLGNRQGVPLQLQELCREENYLLVSIDYRLAPESKLPEIVSDLRAAIDWVHQEGPELFRADPGKMLVAGASAGGYLAQLSGLPEDKDKLPAAIVSYWGFGDILGDWTTRPNPGFGGKREAPSREEAFAGVGDTPITGTSKEDYAARSPLFFYMKRFGKWTEIVSGIDPLKSPEKLTAYCPLRNLSSNYPPILFLHGTADPDVPAEQSIAMHDALKKAGGDSELITVEGGGHGLWGGDKKEIDAAFARSLEFIREHLSAENDPPA